MEPEEKNKTDLPTVSKWQIGLFLWLKALSRGCGLPQGERSVPLGGVPRGGAPSGRFFGDFLIGEKVTRGLGRSAQMVGRRSQRLRKNSPGLEGRSALLTGGSASLAKALVHGSGPKVF